MVMCWLQAAFCFRLQAKQCLKHGFNLCHPWDIPGLPSAAAQKGNHHSSTPWSHHARLPGLSPRSVRPLKAFLVLRKTRWSLSSYILPQKSIFVKNVRKACTVYCWCLETLSETVAWKGKTLLTRLCCAINWAHTAGLEEISYAWFCLIDLDNFSILEKEIA